MRAFIDDMATGAVLINTFETDADRQPGIISSLKTFTETFSRYLPGFVSTSVHQSLDGRRVLNYVQWVSREHLAAMLATPEFAAHMAEVQSLADHIDPVFYRVAFVGARVDADL